MKALKLTTILFFALAFTAIIPKVADAATPKKTKITKISSNASQIKLTWSKKAGVTGYKIYQSTDKKKYKLVKTIKKASTTTYTKTGLTFNKKYYYKIKTYKGKRLSAYSNIASIKTKLTKPNLDDIRVYENMITASYSKVIGANCYEIYCSTTSKNAGFEKIDTRSSYRNERINLEFGKTYYYKVRACKLYKEKMYYGPYSSVKSGTTKTMEQIINAILPESRKFSIAHLINLGATNEIVADLVDSLGIDWELQAKEVARKVVFVEYECMYMSKERLRQMLMDDIDGTRYEYVGFTESEAQYGVDNCGADWNQVALNSARRLLETFPEITPSELKNRLVLIFLFEPEEADYAINQLIF